MTRTPTPFLGEYRGIGTGGGLALAEHHVAAGAVDDLCRVADGDDLVELGRDGVGVGALAGEVGDEAGRGAAPGDAAQVVDDLLAVVPLHGREVLLQFVDGHEDDRPVVLHHDVGRELALGAERGGQVPQEREPSLHLRQQLG
ncbi:hypothetical protein ACH4Q6_07105 [Streptomyces lydicus]|uniref:hypothetical protein n=1 Tax=Streptomyces lydicus TaxID=47763 RepID=UPI0037B0CE92